MKIKLNESYFRDEIIEAFINTIRKFELDTDNRWAYMEVDNYPETGAYKLTSAGLTECDINSGLEVISKKIIAAQRYLTTKRKFWLFGELSRVWKESGLYFTLNIHGPNIKQEIINIDVEITYFDEGWTRETVRDIYSKEYKGELREIFEKFLKVLFVQLENVRRLPHDGFREE